MSAEGVGDVAEWPDHARGLAGVFGPPSEDGFGSATFLEPSGGTTLPEAALGIYRRFVGETWERFGEDAWMSGWAEVEHLTPGEEAADLVSALEALGAPASASVPLLLEVPEGGAEALAAAFDAPDVSEIRVFTLGDGGAVSGLMVAGRRPDEGRDLFVAALLD